jgi:hypothetical protein
MIVCGDLGPVPTVHLYLRVPVSLPAGGWTWGEHASYPGVIAREFIYTEQECRAVVRSYGRVIGEAASVNGRPTLGERFSILARGNTTGLIVGLKEWRWCQREHLYEAASEYLSGWQEAIRAYFRMTGEFFGRGGFRDFVYSPELVRLDAIPTQPAPVTNLPHVRDKEDVPHEHALPSLWGLSEPA